jgi:hypothetical protein
MRVCTAAGPEKSVTRVVFGQVGSGARLLLFCALSLVAGSSLAATVYDAGTLNFSTTNQSMWGTGGAFVAQDSTFLGAQWQNKTATIGGIVGSITDTTVYTNPAWWAWYGCVNTINFLCGSEPSKGTQNIIVDTRTGATLGLTTSGKFGLEFGYTVNSGSVNANVAFGAQAALPQSSVNQQQYFNLHTTSNLNGGAISTQSPEAQAYVNAIAQLSGSVSAEACLITFGCANGGFTLPTLNVNQPILSIDPNSLNVVPDALPPLNAGDPRQPLASLTLAAQGLTLEGALSATGEPGFKLTGPPNNITYVSTEPPVPSLTANLASIGFQLPNIATNGGVSGDAIKSSGSDPFLTALVDVSGVATLAGFPTQLGVDLIDAGGFKVSAQFFALDVNAGPQLSLGQNFDLKPTLMVKLAFSRPVMIAGESGLQDSWEGPWGGLPDIALLGTTTFTPTFWLDAPLTNNTSIDLGLIGLLDVLKFQFTASAGGIDILGTSPVSLNSLLGLGNQLFSTPTLDFSVLDNTFQLGGFNMIDGAPFTITVPEPDTLALLIMALAALLLAWRARNRKPGGRIAGAQA